jgi:hypothetical protein
MTAKSPVTAASVARAARAEFGDQVLEGLRARQFAMTTLYPWAIAARAS